MSVASVPSVRSIQDLKWRVAKLMEETLALYREAGNLDLFERSVKLAREMYETELKPSAHKGHLTWDYVNQVGKGIEKVEGVVSKWRAAGRLVECRTVQIARGFGRPVDQVEAQCFGDWAVHPHLDVPDLYVITLLPLGLNLPPDWCSFRTEEQAIEAMVEIARLRNSWSVVTQADLTLELKSRIQAIAAKHVAVEGPLGAAVKADRNRLGMRLDVRPNGYGAALG